MKLKPSVKDFGLSRGTIIVRKGFLKMLEVNSRILNLSHEHFKGERQREWHPKSINFILEYRNRHLQGNLKEMLLKRSLSKVYRRIL